MKINIADALAVQGVALNERQNFVVLGQHGGWQVLQQFENAGAVAQTATSYFSNHERMDGDLRALQQLGQLSVALAQVVNPHGRVDQDQGAVPCRLRGAAFNAG